MAKYKLEAYKKKRNFNKITEPGDEEATFDWVVDRPIFVI